MPVVISDETLKQAGLDEREARIEIACRLFDAGKLMLWHAAQLAGLSRVELEYELRQRRIAIYRPSADDLKADLLALDHLGI